MATLGLTRELYFTTTTVVDWIDVFTRPVYKNIVVESLRYCQAQKGLDIYAWVLMTNHLHTIVGIRKPDTSIGDILRDIKKIGLYSSEPCQTGDSGAARTLSL